HRAEGNLEHAVNAVEQMLRRVGVLRLTGVAGADRTRAALLEDAVRFLDRLLATQEDEPRLRLVQSLACYHAGTIHFQLGRVKEARQRFDQGLALIEELRKETVSPIPSESLDRIEGLIRNARGLLHVRAGEIKEARV